MKQVPENLNGKVELYSGDIPELISELESLGFTHAYIDGGAVITSFLNLKLINELIITQAPILLGSGKRLFGLIRHQIKLNNPQIIAFENDYIQLKYELSYG